MEYDESFFSNSVNYRSVGKTSVHYHPRTKKTNESSPLTVKVRSVPSKWEPRVLTETSLNAGFGSKQSRFAPTNAYTESLPGPGMYKNTDDFIFRSPSISRKGYSNAFASTSPKLDRSATYEPSVSEVSSSMSGPGPGDYNIGTTLRTDKVNLKGSATFVPPMKPDRRPYSDPIHSGLGPGTYNLRDFRQTRGGRAHPSHMYRSVVPRASFLVKESTAPPVGSYDPLLDRPQRGDNTEEWWSRSTAPRTVVFAAAAASSGPGPGTYFTPNNMQERPESLRQSGSASGPIRPTSSSVLSRPRTSGTASSHGQPSLSRFADSYMGRLDLAANTPGPGWYEPLQYTQDPSLGAGQLSAAFKSTSPTRVPLTKPKAYRPPGPAYYSPVLPSSKKFSVNVDNRWE